MRALPATSAAPPSGVPLFVEPLRGDPSLLVERASRAFETTLQVSIVLPLFALGCAMVLIPLVGLSAGLAVILTDLRIVVGLGVPVALASALTSWSHKLQQRRLDLLQLDD